MTGILVKSVTYDAAMQALLVNGILQEKDYLYLKSFVCRLNLKVNCLVLPLVDNSIFIQQSRRLCRFTESVAADHLNDNLKVL